MSEANTAPARTAQDSRRRWLTILGVVVIVCGLIYGLYWLFDARFYVATDDAYVGGDIVSITSRESGTVLALHADNTQSVKRGQLLVEIDPIKANVAMASAEADLAHTVRAVRTEFSKTEEYRAQIAAAKVALAQAQSDYSRRASAGNAVSHEELAHAQDAVAAAQASLRVAQSDLAEAEASVSGTSIADNPDVLAAIARLRQAAIVLAHMHLTAPVDGIVAQRTVQLGQQIAPGTPLMAVVPLENVWIDANFKEGQLSAMRIGQPVTVTTDIYGGGTVFHGKIVGLGAGSGNAFALLPPQNASGNWIKIVQRVPVRIALDPRELRDHPLRIGLSVDVSVDVSNASGPAIGSSSAAHEIRSDAGNDGGPQTDRLIARILQQNGA
jgi:membrane fusion protein, multidrug efflux system